MIEFLDENSSVLADYFVCLLCGFFFMSAMRVRVPNRRVRNFNILSTFQYLLSFCGHNNN